MATPRRFFYLFLLSFLTASLQLEAKVTPGTDMDSLFFCTACVVVIGSLNEDLKYLVDSGKYWRQVDLDHRLSIACGHPQIAKGAMNASCGRFMMQHYRTLKHDLYRRYTPGYEEHEELLTVREYCENLHACRPKQLTLHEHYAQAAKNMVGQYEETNSPYLAYQYKKMKERLLM
ncbi:hypothetical protein BESB_038560 [Besnoitia besnoiti]|uniref:Saposin B-type domain-containing protein n=1 Tax=Besnoitia besnoiti TaxID=94643 RepID=A0A2A9MFX0_BESBE|nr:hypothetical protein BESB_038560 [Besnoitia besnoiti]PFH37398.1 hypothetical protein BESB_038560 [Besnoitia besnoiti]